MLHVEIQNSTIDGETRRARLRSNGSDLSWEQVLVGLSAADDPLPARLTEFLATVPYEGYFWETPPVDESKLQDPFEFVVIDSPSVAALRADASDFRAPFDREEDLDGIVSFWNLGGDALLVAPKPQPSAHGYAHLASFVRRAPRSQVLALWRVLARSIRARLGPRPLWVSTSGLGVPWLHVRLDSTPKYYQHRPYRELP